MPFRSVVEPPLAARRAPLNLRTFATPSLASLTLGTTTFIADCAGTLFWEEDRVLIAADLHLEKGSAFAERGVFLPPYDTAATLAKLRALIAFYQPRTLVFLGDSFHDRRAGTRMDEGDKDALALLTRGRDVIWIAGNHDPDVPHFVGTSVDDWRIGDIVLRHEPAATLPPDTLELCGHLHPVARVVAASGSVRRRCFVSDGRRCILPAFGAYAGGLNIKDAAYTALFKGRVTAHVLGQAAVYAVDITRCVGDESRERTRR